ncbi:hypothetical protein [Arthrobacter sp. NA-172]|uniref:hypothetical protein n=1 Tax=Arthrobacter sp. NA-172 TaxID=3367524 RepID=UPI003753FE5D
MGNSGKLAIISAVVSAGLLVLLAITLEETVTYTFLGVLALGYLASVAEVFARRRYFMLVLGSISSILFVAFGIAFLRMWGLAFNQDENALGSAVSSQDSDIYFYLGAVAGCSSLLLLFVGAVWPSRRARKNRAKATARPASRPASRPAARQAPRAGSRPAPAARPAQRPAARPASGAVKRPTPRKPAPPASPKRPTSGSPAQRKAAPKR